MCRQKWSPPSDSTLACLGSDGSLQQIGQPQTNPNRGVPSGNHEPPCKQSPIAKKSISTATGMFHILQQRTRDIIDDINETLFGICLDARLMPMATERQIVRSSASTPSLRARDGSIPMHARMDPGGNVRVVVRVRAFLPRGKLAFLLHTLPWERKADPVNRNRTRRRMPHPNGPLVASHHPAST
jgi:hypothetical protein